jgi:hypothetical protein
MSRQLSRQPSETQLLAIASLAVRQGDRFAVKSSDGSKTYYVTAISCTCPSWQHRGTPCKHMQACSLLCPAAVPHVAKALALTDESLVEGRFLEGDPEPFECTWGEWKEANDFGQVDDVATALRTRGSYTDGGGAGPAWILQLKTFVESVFAGF